MKVKEIYDQEGEGNQNKIENHSKEASFKKNAFGFLVIRDLKFFWHEIKDWDAPGGTRTHDQPF